MSAPADAWYSAVWVAQVRPSTTLTRRPSTTLTRRPHPPPSPAALIRHPHPPPDTPPRRPLCPPAPRSQRVPDDAFVAVANRFVVRDVVEETAAAKDASTPLLHAVRGNEFHYSTNLWQVGEHLSTVNPYGSPGAKPFERLPPERVGVRKHPDDARVVDWLLTFGGDEQVELAPYTNDRLWRALSLLAADRAWPWPPHTPLATDIYPFATPPSRALTVDDMLRLLRDVYRGAAHAQLDLTRTVAAGPYGDPSRYDVAQPFAAPGAGGSFPRAISMFRTSYAHVTEIGRCARRSGGAAAPGAGASASPGPSAGAARVWVTQGAPHAAVFTPLHVLPDAADPAAQRLPPSLAGGSLHRADAFDANGSFFWQTNVVNNWCRANGYDLAWEVIESAQVAAEAAAAAAAAAAEAAAAVAPSASAASAILAAVDDANAAASWRAWRSLGIQLMTKLHDGYHVATPLADPTLNVVKLFYPAWWLEKVGYYGPRYYPCYGPCDEDEPQAFPGNNGPVRHVSSLASAAPVAPHIAAHPTAAVPVTAPTRGVPGLEQTNLGERLPAELRQQWAPLVAKQARQATVPSILPQTPRPLHANTMLSAAHAPQLASSLADRPPDVHTAHNARITPLIAVFVAMLVGLVLFGGGVAVGAASQRHADARARAPWPKAEPGSQSDAAYERFG